MRICGLYCGWFCGDIWTRRNDDDDDGINLTKQIIPKTTALYHWAKPHIASSSNVYGTSYITRSCDAYFTPPNRTHIWNLHLKNTQQNDILWPHSLYSIVECNIHFIYNVRGVGWEVVFDNKRADTPHSVAAPAYILQLINRLRHIHKIGTHDDDMGGSHRFVLPPIALLQHTHI